MTKPLPPLADIVRFPEHYLDPKIVSELANELIKAKEEAQKWKNNHDNRVEAARVLIERLDVPLERVGAYRQYLAALTKADTLTVLLKTEGKS